MAKDRKPVTELTDEELQREWEGWMWSESVQGLSADQRDRCIEVEREMDRRDSPTAQEGK